jgi:hypothetical protein
VFPGLATLAAEGMSWTDLQDFSGRPDFELSRRERVVSTLLDRLKADHGELLGYEASGSKNRYPLSDLDVTLFSAAPGANPERAVAQFYRRFRRAFDQDPSALLDANVYTEPDEPQWFKQDPTLSVLTQRRSLERRRDEVEIVFSLATLARAMGPVPWGDFKSRLRAEAGAQWPMVRSRVQEAERIWKSVGDEFQPCVRELSEQAPGTTPKVLAARASDDLYARTLFRAAKVRDEWESVVAQLRERSKNPALRERFDTLTIQLDRLRARARLFKFDAYTSRGAIRRVLHSQQEAPSTSLSLSDLVSGMNEELAYLGRGIVPFLDEGRPAAAIRGSKYGIRFFDAAAALAESLDEPQFAAELKWSGTQIEMLREQNRAAELALPSVKDLLAEQLRRSFKGQGPYDYIRTVAAYLTVRALEAVTVGA